MLSHKKRGQKLSLSCMQHDGWLERNICAPLACWLSCSPLVFSVAGCPKSWQSCLTSYHPISHPALVLGLTGFLQELSATEEVRQNVITHNARLAMQPHAVVKRAHFVQEKKFTKHTWGTLYRTTCPRDFCPSPQFFPQASLVSAFCCYYRAVVLFRAFQVSLNIKILLTEWPQCCLLRVPNGKWCHYCMSEPSLQSLLKRERQRYFCVNLHIEKITTLWHFQRIEYNKHLTLTLIVFW